MAAATQKQKTEGTEEEVLSLDTIYASNLYKLRS